MRRLKLQPAVLELRSPFIVGWALMFVTLPTRGFSESPLSALVRQADDEYLGRQNLDNVRRALDLLRREVAQNPQDYEAWWRVARSNCFLARHSPVSEKIQLLEEAIGAGKKAVALQPNRAEGHFWLGADYGLLAEEQGPWKGLWLINSIQKEMETVARLDPDYEQAGGLRTLARIYYRAPFFKGGDKRRSIQSLEECLKRYPDNSLALLYLTDSYLATGRRAEARALLEKILSLCPDPLYGPELADNQAEARNRLSKIFRLGE